MHSILVCFKEQDVLGNSLMVKVAMFPWIWLFMKPPKQEAQTSPYVAVTPEVDNYSGKYLG
jgi:hypothetical protein